MKGQPECGADGGPTNQRLLLEVQSVRVGHTSGTAGRRDSVAAAPESGQPAGHGDTATHQLLVGTSETRSADADVFPGHYSAVSRRFLDHDAFIFGFVLPVLGLLAAVIVFLARSAVAARFTVSLQVDRRARDKMRRKRHLQLFLFLKVTTLISTVAAMGTLAKLTGNYTQRGSSGPLQTQGRL